MNALFLLISTCSILDQIAPMGAYSRVGAYMSEISSRVGVGYLRSAIKGEGLIKF